MGLCALLHRLRFVGATWVVGSALAGASALAGTGEEGVGGTLTEGDLRNLIADMTLAEEVSMIHGAPEGSNCNSDPAAGPIFPVVSPSFQGCAGQAGFNAGVARLGIPPLRQTDGPAGVRLRHMETALPAPVGLAATFDRDAARDYGVVIGREGRATNQDVLYAPMINLVAVPTAGRNFETLGEDPFLMGELVAEEVKGVQGEGLIATLKHFAMNDFENARQQTSVAIGEQALHELELQAFEKGIGAGAGAIMCAYNRLDGVYSCSNETLLKRILRGLFGFQGWVLSDFGATHRLSDLQYGLDSAMPNGNAAGLRDEPDPGTLTDVGTGQPIGTLTGAVTSGTEAIPLSNNFPAVPAYAGAEWKAALDEAVFHILTSMNAFGLLEGTRYGSRFSDGTPFVPARPDLDSLKPADFAIAQAIAEGSATLLKNDGGLLPLTRRDLSGAGLLVMGPTAVAPYVGGGGSAHVIPFDDVPSPLGALVAAAGEGAHIRYVAGYDLDGQLVPSSAVSAPAGSAFAGQQGWLRTQIATTLPPSGSAPDPCSADCAADQLDATVDYVTAPLPANTAWRWQGAFTAPSAGTWQLKIFGVNQGGAQLFVDGLATTPNRVINMGAYGVSAGPAGGANPVSSWNALVQIQKSHDPNLPRMQQAGFTVTLAAGETHQLDLRAYAGATEALQIRFAWVPPDWQSHAVSEAVAAARGAKAVVIFAYDEGTEGSDRGGNDQAAGLRLPGYQDELIRAVASVNPRTAVVLNSGDPVLMPWVNEVAAILEMWYPGQRGGPATANVLLGRANPAGKSPLTFPVDPALLPTASPGCDPAAITANPPNDGNCSLYPGVFLPGFVSGNHSYKTIDFAANGILVGYRWYDQHGVEPLFPFGQGLSYTTFRYSGLEVERRRGGLGVAFTVRNAGRVKGVEVPQVYLGPPRDPPAGAQFAIRKLVGFERVELGPGQSQRVEVQVDARELAYWSEAQHGWVVPGGERRLYVGASSRDIRLQGSTGRYDDGGRD